MWLFTIEKEPRLEYLSFAHQYIFRRVEMKLLSLLFVFSIVFPVSALAQNIVLDERAYYNSDGNAPIMQDQGSLSVLSSWEAAEQFCQSGPHDYSTLILSRRMTFDEAEQCSYYRSENFIEVQDPSIGYMYLDMESSENDVLSNYRMWTDPNMPDDDWQLYEYLRRDGRSLRDLLKTSAPETCTTNNALACADGSYCCKGKCIPNSDSCD